ncbi:glycosyltransferase family 2 protein [Helicobacter sp. 23-1045]
MNNINKNSQDSAKIAESNAKITESVCCPPLLSILIPTYNRLSQLKRAIDSILSQNYNNEFDGKIEVIVQDNASTDGTFAYLQTLKNPLLKIYQNPQNLHIYGNMVAPLKNANGKFVMYLTDDDYLLPHSLRKIVALLENTKYDYIRLNLITFFEKSISASIHRSIPKMLDSANATLPQLASMLTSAHILTGNIYRKERVSLEMIEEARDDEIQRWFAYVVLSTAMVENMAFIPEVLIMHTWENELFWDGEECNGDYNKYSVVTDGLYKVFAESALSDDLKRAIFILEDPNIKLYPYTTKYLTKSDIFKANMRRSIIKNGVKFKKMVKNIVFRL